MTIEEIFNKEPTDNSLMVSIQSGDRIAFETIYDRYSSKLYGICLRILRNESDANDAMSDIFLEIWQRADRFDPGRGMANQYLTNLTRCRAIDFLRKRVSKAIGQSNYRHHFTTITSTVDANQPMQNAVSQEEREILSAAIKNLTAPARNLLNLAFFSGLSHSEIAKQESMPLGTVKTGIRRAILSLQETLQQMRETEVSK